MGSPYDIIGGAGMRHPKIIMDKDRGEPFCDLYSQLYKPLPYDLRTLFVFFFITKASLTFLLLTIFKT